jgi:hypothetical protein
VVRESILCCVSWTVTHNEYMLSPDLLPPLLSRPKARRMRMHFHDLVDKVLLSLPCPSCLFPTQPINRINPFNWRIHHGVDATTRE